MKTTTKEVTVYICDVCGKGDDTWPRICLGCGRHFCWDCAKKQTEDYPEALYFSSSADGRYCSDCYADKIGGDDPLFNAYLALRDLKEHLKDMTKKAGAKGDRLNDTIKTLHQECLRKWGIEK